jgi:hypothetical protein
MWSMTCGNSTYYTGANCGSANNYISSSTYASEPYALSDGGYSLTYGLPMAQYETSLATNPSNYAAANSADLYIPANFKSSYLEQFNLQVQKQYKNQILTAGFVGSLGRKLPSKQNLNQPTSATFTHYPMYSSAHDWMDSVAVTESLSAANSAWEAGEATYEWHNSHGLNANVNYTWARTEGQGTSDGKCVLYGCLRDDGNGNPVVVRGWQEYSYDGSTSHRAAGMVTYNLPFGKNLHGPLGAAVKGWALNGTGSWNTGAWTAITSSINRSGITTGSEYPNKIPGVSVKPKHQTLANWVNAAAFSENAEGLLGNANRSLVQEPRTRDADLSLGKTFSVWEKMQLQFRAEAFNVTNTPSYGGGSGGGPGGPPGGGGGGGGTYAISSYTSSGIGEATSGFGDIDAGSGNRILQFGLKLVF